MFHVITPAGVSMAADTIRSLRNSLIFPDWCCNSRKIYTWIRDSCFCYWFFWATGLIMANQAVNIFSVIEIISFVRYVAIANMALSTASFIWGNGDTKVINQVIFSMKFCFLTFNVCSESLPIPVTCFQYIISNIIMTFETGFCAFIGGRRKKIFMNFKSY